MKLNLGCGTHYAPGWVNVDTHLASQSGETWTADVLALALPFRDDAFDRVLCSHVLEHVEWDFLPEVLAEVRRVLRPGGRMLAAGPDVHRTVRRFSRGQEPWFMVENVIEHRAIPGTSDHPEEGHAWNCHEERLVALLATNGFEVVARIPFPDYGVEVEGWPLVGTAPWWCAVEVARRPSPPV